MPVAGTMCAARRVVSGFVAVGGASCCLGSVFLWWGLRVPGRFFFFMPLVFAYAVLRSMVVMAVVEGEGGDGDSSTVSGGRAGGGGGVQVGRRGSGGYFLWG